MDFFLKNATDYYIRMSLQNRVLVSQFYYKNRSNNFITLLSLSRHKKRSLDYGNFKAERISPYTETLKRKEYRLTPYTEHCVKHVRITNKNSK